MYNISLIILSVQFSCSVVSDSLIHHGLQASLSITNSQSLVKLISFESVMPSTHLIFCHPFSSCLQSFPVSHPYTTTGKTIALTRWTLVGKVMSLLFSMLSKLVITFLPRSKRRLISWLQSPSAVILEPRKIKSDTVSTVSPLFPMK